MGGVRASPPMMNVRSSRSPTPASEYSNVGQVGQIAQMDRNQRYGVPTAVYHGMSGVIPGIFCFFEKYTINI